MNRASFLALFLLAAACASLASTQMVIRLDAKRTSDRAVTLTLVNDTTESIGFNLCTSALERLQDGKWRTLPEHTACTMQLGLLAPGQSVKFEKQLPASLPSGRYRYSTNVEIEGNRKTVASNTFKSARD